MQLTRTRRPHRAPLETCHPCEVEQRPRPSAERVWCRCGKTIGGASVVTDPPVWRERDQQWSVVRRCYCDHCQHLILWREWSDADGVPLGVVLSGPGVVRSRRTIERFLDEHPQAAGLEQT